MGVAVITGSSGLIGSEAAIHFGELGLEVVGIDNDMRQRVLRRRGVDDWNRDRVQERSAGLHPPRPRHPRPGRDPRLFRRYGRAIELVIHAAAQPSHDWAAREPFVDFDINAVGTLNLLEATRLHARAATFIFTSTNKVYGDRPNRSRSSSSRRAGRSSRSTPTANGIREDMSIDQSPAQPVRRVEGRRGCPRAGVRALLRDAHGLLPRRDAHGPEPLGRGAARVPRLRHALRDDRHARTRSSATRESRFETRFTAEDLIRRSTRSSGRRGWPRSTTSAADASATPRCSRRSSSRGDRRRRARVDVRGREPHRRPHLVDRRQRPLRVAYPSWSSSTTFAASSRRSTTRTRIAGAADSAEAPRTA